MRTLLHGLIGITAIALVFLLQVPIAAAHPLGNFTINHYAGLHVTPEKLGIDYVLDMAEIPAFQEINQLDTNRDRSADSTETTNYPFDKCQEIQSHLDLRSNHQPIAIALNQSTVAFPPGVGGLSTLRLTCAFQGALTADKTTQQIEFADASYAQRLGWREITVTSDDVPIQSNLTATSITKRLTEYPNDLLKSPLNQRQISFQINPSLPVDPLVATSTAQSANPSALPLPAANSWGQGLIGRQNDAFTRLITLEDLNLPTIVVALAIAFIWGGLHALSPGHGKTIVGAYLVGARSQVHHALFLGLTVTLTHTAGIFALGLVMLGTSQFILTEQLFPWLSAFSGALVTAIGLHLLIRRLRTLQVFQNWLPRSSDVAAVHPHAATPHADHVHAHDHSHASHHEHQHHHGHSHTHGHAHGHAHEHAHGHAHDHSHDHSHGSHSHSHLPPGANGSPVTWSSILALGISGGLLPCPSALVVLLSAIAIGRIGFGLALVSAFSLGLAAVLTGIGLLLVYTKHLFERLPLQTPKSNLFPAVSALLITLVGIGITTQALLTPTL